MADLANLRIGVDSREVKTAAGELNNLSRASDNAGQSSARLGNGLQGLAKSLAGLGIGAAVVQIIRMGIEFEKSMAEISTLVDTSVVSMKELTASVRDQAKEFGGDVQTQAKALYQIISAGASDAATANNILTISNKLAVGGVTDVATAADGLTSVLNAYGNKVAGATAVSDAMFVAMKAGKTTIAELSASIGTVAPLAAQMGISFDELTASTAALTKGGVSTSVAVTGLRAILATIAKPSKEATDLAAELGVEFSSAALKAKGLGGFLEELKQKTGGSSDSMATLFGGVEALIPALALSGQAGKDLAVIMGQMGVKAGATDEAFEKMANTFGFQFNQAIANAKDVALSLGLTIQDLLLPVLKFLNGNLSGIVIALKLAAAALVAYYTATKIAAAYNAALSISLFTTAGATAAFGRSVAALNAVMFLNPAVLFAAAIAAIAYVFISMGDATRAANEALQRNAEIAKAAGVELTAASKAALAAANENKSLGEQTQTAAGHTFTFTDEVKKSTDALRKQAVAAREAKIEILKKQVVEAREIEQASVGTVIRAGGLDMFSPARELGKGDFLRAGSELGKNLSATFTNALSGGRELREATTNYQQAALNVIGLQKQIKEALTTPVGMSELTKDTNAAAAGMGALEKATKKTIDPLQKYRDLIVDMVNEGKKIGMTPEQAKAFDVQVLATEALALGSKELATQLLKVAAANAIKSESDKKSQADDAFTKGALADLQFENSLIGMNTQQRERAVAVRALENAKILEGSAAYIAYLAAVEAGSQGKISEEQDKRIKALQQEIELMGLSANAAIRQAAEFQALALGYEAGTAAFEKFIEKATQEAGLQKTVDGLLKIKEAMQEVKDMTFDIDLEGVFGNVGKAVGGLVNVYEDFAKRQKVLAVAMSKDNKDEVGRRVAQQKSFRNEINLYGNLAASAKGFFKEKSVGYKVIQAAETAFRAFEFAMSIKAIAMKAAETTATVVAEGTKTAVQTASGASKIFSQLGAFAFPIVAAMIAVMASLGGKGGGAASPSIPSAEDMQKQQGAGSVLGDVTAKSDSINRALDIMAANSNTDLEFSNQMLVSLRSIQSNMANLSNNVAKQISVSGGLFDTSKQALGKTGSSGVLGLFGSSTTRELHDIGIDLAASSIAEIIAGGISGQTFQVVQQVKKKSGFFGIGGKTSTSFQTTTGGIDPDVSNSITGVIASLRQGLIDGAAVIGLDGAAAILDSFQVNIGKISLLGLTGKEIEEQLNAVFSKVGDQMAGALLPSLTNLQNIGEGLFETFARVAREYQVVDVALRSIGKEFGAVGLASIEARSALVGLFESLDQFVEQTSFFRDNFLTEAEKIAPITAAVSSELERLGLSSIATIEQFKGVVLGLDLTTLAGSQTYAALLQLAPAFKKVADAQAVIVEAQAKAQADIAAKAAADAKLALEAAEKAAKALQDLQNKRASMEIILMEASGESAAALAARRGMELAAMEQTLRGLQLQIFAAQDAQAASKLASEAQARTAQEAAAAAAAALALGRERQQLEIQLLEVQGFAVEALAARRGLELAGMDASLRELKQQIFAAQDKAEADALAATAANEAAQSLKQYADALSNVSKTIVDEINRLRGVTTSTSAVLLKAQFATVTAQARGGNLDALGKLPELSKSIEAATMASASSVLEVARIRAWLDASLSETLNTQGVAPTATADGLTFDGNNTASANTQQTSGDLSNMSSALNNALYQVAKNTGKSYELLDRWDGDGLPDIREDASDYY